jgi:predicted DNA-binding transcriptional regulator AlpA
MTTRPLIRSDEVADLIGYTSATAFMRERERLERETLFPLPLPTHRHRAYRWRRDEVEAWVQRHGQPRPPVGANLHLLRLAQTA